MSYNTRIFQQASHTTLGASRTSRTRGKIERDEGRANKGALLANFGPREAIKAGSGTAMEAQNQADRLPVAPSESERASRSRLAKKVVPYVAAAAIAGLGIHEAAGAAGSEESNAAKQAAPIEKHLGEQPPTPPTQP